MVAFKSFNFTTVSVELFCLCTCEAVTIVETPPMVIIGVGYVKTPHCLHTLNNVWAQHVSEEAKRRF